MKSDPSRALPLSALRRALLLAGSTALIASSCADRPAYGPESNVFAPRYGYGSAPANLEERPAAPADAPGRANPQVQDGQPRKVPEILRDPSNTTVDLSPPPSKAAPGQAPEQTAPPAEAAPARTPAPALTKAPAEAAPAPAPEAAAPAPERIAAPAPAPVKPAVAREDLPFGQPVVGKKGFVYSPYAPDKGQVDVQDIPSGTKVKCPYTNKVFRVP